MFEKDVNLYLNVYRKIKKVNYNIKKYNKDIFRIYIIYGILYYGIRKNLFQLITF